MGPTLMARGLGVLLVILFIWPASAQPALQLGAVYPTTSAIADKAKWAVFGTRMALKNADKFIDRKQSLNMTLYDDGSDARKGIFAVLDAVQKKNSVGILGAYNSLVSLGVNEIAGYLGVVEVSCCSSSPTLSDKDKYPTFLRAITDDYFEAGLLATAVRDFGWARVAYFNTNDPFGTGARDSFTRVASMYGMELYSGGSYDYASVGNDPQRVVEELKSVALLGYRVITLFMSQQDARDMLQAAHQAGLLGNKDYVFLGGNGWGIDSLFDHWPFAAANPNSLRGILSLAGTACQPETELYKWLAAGLDTPLQGELSMMACLGFDSTALFLRGLNGTLNTLQNINKKYSLDLQPQCLELPTYLSNTSQCSLPQAEAQRILLEAGCVTGACVRCGVCALARQQPQLARSPQLLLLDQTYRQVFVGSTGPFAVTPKGDRSPIGVSFVLRNVHTVIRNGTLQPTFVQVGSFRLQADNNISKLNYTTEAQMVFAGGSHDTPNLVIPLDRPPLGHFTKSVAVQVIWGVLAGCGLVLAAVLAGALHHYRKKLVMRTANPRLMYLCVVGAALLFCSIFPLLPSLSIEGCITHEYLFHLGYATAFGALFIKSFRIQVVFTHTGTNTTLPIRDKQLFLYLGIVIGLVLVYLVVWTVVGQPVLLLVRNQDTLMTYCPTSWWRYSLLIAELIFGLWGIFIASQIHKVPLFYNEAKFIALSVYNWTFVFFITETATITTRLNPTAWLSIKAVAICCTVTTMLLLFFGPKIRQAYKGKGDKNIYTTTNVPPSTRPNNEGTSPTYRTPHNDQAIDHQGTPSPPLNPLPSTVIPMVRLPKKAIEISGEVKLEDKIDVLRGRQGPSNEFDAGRTPSDGEGTHG